jgi:hypothetical protein
MTEAEEKLLMEAAIMDRHIRDFAGFAMLIGCATCSDQRRTTVKALSQRWGDLTFRQLIDRMACHECGNKPSTVALIHHVAKWDLVKPMA